MGCIKSTPFLNYEDMEFLKANTCYNENTIKLWYQAFIKDCPDGRLTKVKFIEMYQAYFISGNPEVFCEHIFRTFDTDGNGYLDFKEFLINLYTTTAGTAEQKLEWAFKIYDVDNNGVIDQDEMKKVFEAIYDIIGTKLINTTIVTPDTRAKNIFKKMDLDGDGFVTKDEFMKGCLQDDELLNILACNAGGGTQNQPKKIPKLTARKYTWRAKKNYVPHKSWGKSWGRRRF